MPEDKSAATAAFTGQDAATSMPLVRDPDTDPWQVAPAAKRRPEERAAVAEHPDDDDEAKATPLVRDPDASELSAEVADSATPEDITLAAETDALALDVAEMPVDSAADTETEETAEAEPIGWLVEREADVEQTPIVGTFDGMEAPGSAIPGTADEATPAASWVLTTDGRAYPGIAFDGIALPYATWLP